MLLLWEWFRIYFESGAVKLMSGDPTWRNLTAMYEYYQNGPLPTWIGWYLQHLPWWFQKATAGATLGMELVLVWMAFLPRRWRIACFCIVTVWQAVVIATANYAFLNYLVLVLAVLLLDDRALRRFVPARWRAGWRLRMSARRRCAQPLKGSVGSGSGSGCGDADVDCVCDDGGAGVDVLEGSSAAELAGGRAGAAADCESIWVVRCDDAASV